MQFWPELWLRHQTRDAQWRHGSVCEDYDAIKVPVYFFGGWADLFRDTPFRIAEHLKAPCKVLMGPWSHLYPHEGVPGPKIDFVAEALRWPRESSSWLICAVIAGCERPRLSAARRKFRSSATATKVARWPSMSRGIRLVSAGMLSRRLLLGVTTQSLAEYRPWAKAC
jgi:predicted acyl esterase